MGLFELAKKAVVTWFGQRTDTEAIERHQQMLDEIDRRHDEQEARVAVLENRIIVRYDEAIESRMGSKLHAN